MATLQYMDYGKIDLNTGNTIEPQKQQEIINDDYLAFLTLTVLFDLVPVLLSFACDFYRDFYAFTSSSKPS